jgi:7-cyano-7-deazaguanine synthase
MLEDRKSALVLFSGGQDSTTCLAWALTRYEVVETIGFDYGQRHAVELDCRLRILESIREKFPEWRDKLGEDRVLSLGVLGEIGDTAMTHDLEIVIAENGLPTSFVPGRNLMFLTVAGAVAYRRGITSLVGGMCETDYSGYPDCRDDTVKAMQQALRLGMDAYFTVETPLMWTNKARTWKIAQELGGQALVDIVTEETHTCYLGDRTHRHDWGYGCGTCPACELRLHGFAHFMGRKASGPARARPR